MVGLITSTSHNRIKNSCIASEVVCIYIYIFIRLAVGLERGTEYSFRLSAITVNGSGPATEWISVETFENDLDGKKTDD